MGASSTHAYVLELDINTILANLNLQVRSYDRKTHQNVNIVLAQVDVNFPAADKFSVCVFRITLETNYTSHITKSIIKHVNMYNVARRIRFVTPRMLNTSSWTCL